MATVLPLSSFIGTPYPTSTLLTVSMGLPLTRAPRATAHQKVQVEESMGSPLPLNTLQKSTPPTLVSSGQPSPQPFPTASCCWGSGVNMIFTMLSRTCLAKATGHRAVMASCQPSGGEQLVAARTPES